MAKPSSIGQATHPSEMNMTECEFLGTCPIFARFRLEGTKNYWIQMYCIGSKQETCARKVLRKQGQVPAATLLPNGKHLDTLSAGPSTGGKAST
jgi:hypothetical protein